MNTHNDPDNAPKGGLFGGRHPILVNAFLIAALAALGLLIVYFSMAIFTKHGQTGMVPNVENMNYASATEKLHDAGFRVEIRDHTLPSSVTQSQSLA